MLSICVSETVMTFYYSNFFQPSLLLLFLDPGSGMGKNQDPGYTSRISHTAMRIKKIIDGKSLHVQYGI